MRPPVNDNVACTLCAIDCHHSDQRETFKSWAIFKFLSTNCTSHQHKLWKLPSAPRSSSSRSRRRCVRAATPPRCLTHTAQAHKPEIHFNFFFDQCFFTIGAKNVYVTRHTHTVTLQLPQLFGVFLFEPCKGYPLFWHDFILRPKSRKTCLILDKAVELADALDCCDAQP